MSMYSAYIDRMLVSNWSPDKVRQSPGNFLGTDPLPNA